MDETNIKVTKISASFGGKVNIGNYQNVDLAVTVEAEVREGDDVHEVIIEAQRIARDAVMAEATAIPSPQARGWRDAVRSAPDPDKLPY